MFEPASTPRVFGLPPGVDFPAELVAGIRDRMAGRPPEAMARVTLFLNTGKMRDRVRAAFQAAGPGFLPRLKLLTDIGDDPALDALPAVPRIRRRLEFSVPVARFLAAEPQFAPGTAVFDLADRLAGLAEEMQDENVTPEAFAQPGLAEDHAAHWERSLAFLRIIAPWFDSDMAPDAATRLRRAAETLVARWQGQRPADPVLIAGSTGSRGTTQLLMRAVAGLPQGALILPGYDFGMPDFGWNSLGSDEPPNEDHPQFRFARLTAALGIGPGQVGRWTDAPPADPARNRLVSLALRPAPVTDQWMREGALFGPPGPATDRLTLIEAPGPRAEALAIALVLRKAAEDGRRAALVTPDQSLVRRVTAALDRWALIPDNSAGAPLHLTAPGRFLRQIAGLFGRPMTIDALLALLKHPVAGTGAGERGPHLRHTRDLELKLRRHGPPFPDAAAIIGWAAAPGDAAPADWADWLAGILARLPADGAARLALDWVDLLLALANDLAAGPGGQAADSALWQEEAGDSAARAMALLRAEAPFGGPLDAPAFATLLARLLEGERVRAAHGAHPLISVQGTREARELQADLVILGGLNDGTWPATATPDPWLSRQMRLKVGLLLPERQIGLAAHDFQIAAGAAEVVLSRAQRDDQAETVASRWLDRLKNLIGGLDQGPEALASMRARGAVWLDLARQIEVPPLDRPAPRPAPRPPVAARPSELPVTAIRTLIRDPYAVYARYVLRLFPLDPLLPGPDVRLRGQILHKIVETFVRERPQSEDPAAAKARLLAGAETILAAEVAWPSAQRLWLARIGRMADRFLLAEGAREAAGIPVVLEDKGWIDLPGLSFRITARPDRIDQMADGSLHIYDYKTGTPPSPEQQKYFDKQLLIEAAMAERDGFRGIGPHPVSAVSYIHLGASAKDRVTTRDEGDFDRVWDELAGLIARYRNPRQGYTARRALFEAAEQGDYDHLSRHGEWQVSDPPEPEDVG